MIRVFKKIFAAKEKNNAEGKYLNSESGTLENSDSLMQQKEKEKGKTVPMRRYKILRAEFVVLFFLFAAAVLFNYDYIVFKILISFNYSYTEALDKIYEEQLEADEKGNYFKYFDELAIKSVIDNIQKENNDIFTFLYTPANYEQTERYLEEEKVSIKEISKDSAIIRLPAFTAENTEDLKEILSTRKYKNLALDLRKNPGGYVNEARKSADLFLDKDMLIYSGKSRNIFYNKEYYAKTERKYSFENIFILQDSETASAAEIFINALNDNLDNVALIGETTYGKGIGQFQYNLKDGYAVKATAVKFYSPNGICINQRGIDAEIKCQSQEAYNELEKILLGDAAE